MLLPFSLVSAAVLFLKLYFVKSNPPYIFLDLLMDFALTGYTSKRAGCVYEEEKLLTLHPILLVVINPVEIVKSLCN